MKVFGSYLFLCFFLILGACHGRRALINEATIAPLVNEISGQKDFKIYSNAESKKIIVLFYSRQQGQAMVAAHYEGGSLLQQRNLTVNLGTNTWGCYFPFKASGIYNVKFNMHNLERNGKIFKSVS